MRDLWDTRVKISKGLVTIPKQLTSIGVKRLHHIFNTLMFSASAIKSKQMTEQSNNNNNEDHSSIVINNKSKKSTKDKELLKVLEALESQGFKLFDYHES